MNVTCISKTFQQLFGEPCWGLHYDPQLNLSMNFGTPSLRVLREPFKTKSKSETVQRLAARRLVKIRGRWWLLLSCCHWLLSSAEHRLATSSSSYRRIQCAIRQLNGQKLISAQIEPTTGATRFGFDLGGVLECRRFGKDSNEELWILYKPSRYCLSVYANGAFSHQRSSDFTKRFRPIEDRVRLEKP